MDVTTKRIGGGITVVSLSGRMVRGDEILAMERMVADLVRKDNKKLILDMAGVDYVDSAGIGVIAACASTAKDAGGGLRVAGARGRVEQVFQAMRLEMIVPWHPTLEAASDGFRG